MAIQISKHPHGHPKATTYVALVNAIVLLIVTAVVIFEGINRLTNHPPHIEGLPVLIVSVIAAIFMVIGAVILGKDASKEDLHIRSVLLRYCRRWRCISRCCHIWRDNLFYRKILLA